MKKTTLTFFILVWFSGTLIFIIACEYKGPEAVWDPNRQGAPNPIIRTIEPADSAAPGVTKIILHGENFCVNAEDNYVYFNKVKAIVKSTTETELVLYRPNLYGDNITIKVTVKGAFQFANFTPYQVNYCGGQYFPIEDGNEKINDFAVGAEENLLIHTNKKIFYQFTTDGKLTELIPSTPQKLSYDLKMGPGGTVIMARDQNLLLQWQTGGTAFENYVTGLPAKVKYFDFDENLNIYAGGKKSGLILIKPDGSSSSIGIYDNYDIKSIRVYYGEVYVAAEYVGTEELAVRTGIWKHPIISSDGILGSQTLVLNWAETGDFTETVLSDITFDEEGIMYIATDGGPINTLDPILMMFPDGTLDTFYIGGLIQGPILGLVWGNGEYLYLNKAEPKGGDPKERGIYRLGMGKNSAPYYVRE